MKNNILTYLSNILSRRATLIAVSLVAFAGITAGAAPTKITASIDSSAILMGKRATITIESLVPASHGNDIQLLVPKDTLVKNVEVVETQLVDSATSGDMLQLRHKILIQSFDSGLYTIPPVKVLIGKDTALSNHLILKVVPVAVDSLNGKIHDYAGVADPGHNFFDFIPQEALKWLKWLLLALVIVGAGIFVYLKFIRKRGEKGEHKKIIIVPPYEEAIRDLQDLKSRNLWENGHEKEYYTRLTDILRHYLDRRFGIAAMEMTSSEILKKLSENQETRLTRSQMQSILSMADFVKFAKVRPLPEDNVKTLNSAFEFVESTKPQPEVQGESSTSDNVKTTKK